MRDRNVPTMNVKENKDNFEVEIAVSGFSKKDIKVTMENDILHITAQNSLEEVDEKEQYMRKEFSDHAFDRKLQLPPNIDQTKNVDATYKDEILALRIGKKEEAKEPPKKIIDIV